jgi:membrane protease YdiL (CAAX protease family)
MWAANLFEIAIGLWFVRRYYRDRVDLFSSKGWSLALLLCCWLIALGLSISRVRWIPLSHLHFGIVVQHLLLFCLVGYAEELGFRGVWFAHFPQRPVFSILAGSLLFGLWHLHVDLPSAIIAFLVGLLFAVTRYRGASILVLAVAHGLIDFVDGWLAPATGFPLSLAITLIIAVFGYLILLALLFWVPRRGKEV